MIDVVSTTTHEPWSVIWEMGLYEFYNIYYYAMQKLQIERRLTKQFQKIY